jgi:hypothetical protein
MAGKATLPWGKGLPRADGDSLHPLHPENPASNGLGYPGKSLYQIRFIRLVVNMKNMAGELSAKLPESWY